MAIDTETKRRSAMTTMLPGVRTMLPVADSSIDQADRQHNALLYGGIAATVTTPTEGGAFGGFMVFFYALLEEEARRRGSVRR